MSFMAMVPFRFIVNFVKKRLDLKGNNCYIFMYNELR